MPVLTRRRALALAGTTLAAPALAQTKQAPGVTATELLIGQTMPYSGPASSFAEGLQRRFGRPDRPVGGIHKL